MRGFLGGVGSAIGIAVAFLAVIGPPSGAGQANAASNGAASFQAQDWATAPALDGLRAMIRVGNIPGVEAALSSLPPHGPQFTPNEQAMVRAVYALFTERHPKVIEFTRNWLQAAPGSPLAMTARGWSLQAEGWAMRGRAAAADTTPEALAAFSAAHSEGLALMQAAVAAAPRLLPASDGVIAMSYTTGRADLIAPELERIMALYPNRPSLAHAGHGLAPTWGGGILAMKELCETYAPLISELPGYDAGVCLIDATMESGFLKGAEREALMQVILASDNALVREWAGISGWVPGKSQIERLAHLDMVKRERGLTFAEAQVYDQDAVRIARLAGEQRPAEIPAALERDLAEARAQADNNPGEWSGVARYLTLARQAEAIIGAPADPEDLWRRQIGALALAPFEPKAWAAVGTAMIERSAPSDLSDLTRAEPYLINAVAYSNHSANNLSLLLEPKLALVMQSAQSGGPAPNSEAWNEAVLCPMVRQARLLTAICNARELELGECSGLQTSEVQLTTMIEGITSAGLCETETSSPLRDIVYTPVKVELPAG